MAKKERYLDLTDWARKSYWEKQKELNATMQLARRFRDQQWRKRIAQSSDPQMSSMLAWSGGANLSEPLGTTAGAMMLQRYFHPTGIDRSDKAMQELGKEIEAKTADVLQTYHPMEQREQELKKLIPSVNYLQKKEMKRNQVGNFLDPAIIKALRDYLGTGE